MRERVIGYLVSCGWRHKREEDDVFIRHPVKMTLALDGSEIFLDDIRVDYFHRDGGHGSAAMDDLCAAADETGMKIVLAPVPEMHADMDDLLRFYERFDFERDGEFLVRRELSPSNGI